VLPFHWNGLTMRGDSTPTTCDVSIVA